MKKKFLIIIMVLAFALTGMVFYACSSADIVTVKFYVDGELYKTCSVPAGGDLDEVPDVPAKEGYKGRWSETDFDELTKSLNVYAIYEEDTYTVSFFVDGVLYDSVTAKKGKTIARIPEVPVKEGYDGTWSVTGFSGVNNNTAVHAIYSIKPVYVTFYKNTYSEAEVTVGKKPAAKVYYEKCGKGYVLTADETFSEGKKYYVSTREVYSMSEIKNGSIGVVPEVPVSDGLSAKWMVITATDEGETLTEFIPTLLTGNMSVLAYEYVTVTLVDTVNGKTENQVLEFDVGTKASSFPSVIGETKDYDFFGWYTDVQLRIPMTFPYVFGSNTVLYSKWMKDAATDGLIYLNGQVVGYEGEETVVHIPYRYRDEEKNFVNVTGVAGEAFLGNTAITDVYISGTVTDIGDRAFKDCSGLINVHFDDGCYLETIGEGAFASCSALTAMEVCEKTLSIGTGAFKGCETLSTIRNLNLSLINEVPDEAFYACRQLGNVYLPETVTRIGNSAFEHDDNIKVYFDDSANLSVIGARAFADCMYFEGVDAINLTAIGEKAYAGSKSISTVTFIAGCETFDLFDEIEGVEPSSGFYTVISGGKSYAVPGYLSAITFAAGAGKKIAAGSAAGLYTLCKITIAEGVTEIEESAFETDPDKIALNKEELKLSLPSTLEKIGNRAFVGRTDLENVVFPAALKSIGDYAFYGLNRLDTVSIGNKNSLSYSGRGAFDDTPWYKNYVGVIMLGSVVLGISESYCRSAGVETIYAQDMRMCTAISPYAFAENKYLKSVTLGSNIAKVGDFAFNNCSELKTFAFNFCDTLRTVGENVLAGCEKLQDLTLYNDIKLLDKETVEGGTVVTKSYLFEEVPLTLEVLRVEFSGTSEEVSAAMMESFIGVKCVHIGDGFTTISEGAFAMCADLTAVYFGKDIKEIGKAAFKNLTELSRADFAKCDSLEIISENAFYGTSVNGVVFPATTRIIDAGAFFGACLTDVEIVGSIETIGESAFENNASLTRVAIGNTVVSLGDYAFKGCGIETFTVPSSLSEERIGKGVLALNNELQHLTSSQRLVVSKLFTFDDNGEEKCIIPMNFATVRITGGEIGVNQYKDITTIQTVTIEKGVTTIGRSAFEGCSSVRNVVIPNTVGMIGERAFAFCSKLTSVNIDDVDSQLMFVGGEVFKGDSSLGYIVFPSVLRDGDWTGIFEGCSKLSTTNIPTAIKEIGERAYYGCSSLVNLDMHDGITHIGANAFYGCGKIDFDDVRFDELAFIGEGAFANCASLHGIKAEQAKEIGANAFSGCAGIEEITVNNRAISYYISEVEHIVTVNVVGSPAQNAFAGCTNLSTVVIYGGESSAIENAVSGLDLNSVLVFVNKEIYSVVADSIAVHVNPTDEGKFLFEYHEDGTATLLGMNTETDAESSMYLPSEVVHGGRTYTITEIGRNAFVSIKDVLNIVVIPSQITTIGERAFENCSALTDLRFESGSRLTKIDKNAFSGCSAVRKISFPSSLETIADSAFQNCYNLEKIGFYANSGLKKIGSYAFFNATLLSGVALTGPVESIGYSAFSGCTSMTGIDFGEKTKITAIADSLFFGCESLASIDIPTTVETIGKNAFNTCSSLAEIVIPDSVTTISVAAFSSSGITSVTMGKNVTNIGATAFNACENLLSVVIPDSVKTLGESAFRGCIAANELTIGKGVESIGAGAFERMVNLARVYYNAENVTDLPDDANVFFNAGQKTAISVVIGNNVIKIPSNLFNAQSNAPTVSSVEFTETSSCRTIGEKAFAYLDRITQITLPVSVTYIGASAFYNATYLKVYMEAKRSPAGSDASWAAGMFYSPVYGVNNLTSGEFGYVLHENKAYLTDYTGGEEVVELPSTLNGYPLTSAGITFENNSAVKKVILHGGITNIGSYYGCINLDTLDIGGNINEIPDRAFYGCTALDSLQLPSTVEKIGENAFYGCEALEIVYLKGSAAVSLLDSEQTCGGLTQQAKSLYVDISIDFEGIENSEFNLLPVTVDNYRVFTKHYWNIGESSYDTTFAYIIRENKEEYSLTIDGEGNMGDHNDHWYAFSDQIVSIIVRESVKTLGRSAFGALNNLREVYYNSVSADYYEDKTLFQNSGTAAGIKLTVGKDVVKLPNYLFSDNLNLKEVIFEAGVLTEIGESAFRGCASVTQITIPNTVKTVGEQAFANISGLKTLTIGINVTNIGRRAFYGADDLQAVYYNAINANAPEGNMAYFACDAAMNVQRIGFTLYVGNAVVKIPAYTFYECVNLRNISFAANGVIEEIGAEAFYKCDSIATVTLPGTLKTMDDRAFAEASELSNIGFTPGTIALTTIGKEALLNTAFYKNNENWTYSDQESTQGVLYLANKFLIRAKAGLSGEYIISGYTTVVANNAFDGCDALEYVRIPASVENIGTEAFKGCGSLNTIYVASKAVAQGFANINSYGGVLASALHVYIAKTLISENNIRVGSYLQNNFTEIGELVTFTTGAYYIYTKAAWTTGEVKAYLVNDEFDIGKYILKIVGVGEMADYSLLESAPWYSYNRKISSVNVGNGISRVGNYAFYNCMEVKSLNLDNTVTDIGQHSFDSCSSLTAISIPVNVKTIGDSAFNGCTALTNINYFATRVTDLAENNGVFYDAGKEAATPVKVEIGREVEYLPAYLFYPNTEQEGMPRVGMVEFLSLNNINHCTKIAPYAFAYLKNLTTLKFASGDRLQEIDEGAFIGCESLGIINITLGVKYIGKDAFKDCSTVSQVVFYATEFVVGEQGNKPFAGVGSALSDGFTLNISAKSQSIPSYIFEGAESLRGFTFEEGCQCVDIGTGAFADCVRITEVTVPDSVFTIGEGAFSGCTSVTKFIVPFVGGLANEVEASAKTLFGYIFGTEQKAGCTATLQTYGGASITYYIPDSIMQVEVTKYVNLYYGAFMRCVNLRAVKLNQENMMDTVIQYEIGEDGKEQIKAQITNGSVVDTYAFYGCTLLDSVSLTSALINIGQEAFKDCQNMSEFTVSENVKNIGISAFENCRALANIYFNAINCNDVGANIGTQSEHSNNAFANVGTDKLGTNVVFGYQVKRVPALLFNTESGKTPAKLLSVSFTETEKNPSVCKEIGKKAFAGAGAGDKELTDITLPDTLESIGEEAFVDTAYYKVKAKSSIIYIGIYLIKVLYQNVTSTSELSINNGTRLVADYALSGCKYLMTVNAPDSLKYIGDYAFSGCTSLQKVGFGVSSALTKIGKYAFSNCSQLGSQPIEEGSQDVTGLNIRSQVEEIGDYAFSGCEGLTKVYIDSTKIAATIRNNGYAGDNAYGGLIYNNMQYIYIPEGCATSSSIINSYNEGPVVNGYKRYTKQ